MVVMRSRNAVRAVTPVGRITCCLKLVLYEPSKVPKTRVQGKKRYLSNRGWVERESSGGG